MKRIITRSQDESGQVLVLAAFFLVVLVGMGALVVDAGSWYRADRAAQTAADAAALAGAQDLPDDEAAETSADDYWDMNQDFSNAVSGDNFGVCIGEARDTDDDDDPDALDPTACEESEYEITTEVKRDAGSFLARVFGILKVTVEADAAAQVFAPLEMKNVAPIAVKDTAACIVLHPECFGTTVTLSFDESRISSSSMGLVDLRCQSPSAPVDCEGGSEGSEGSEGCGGHGGNVGHGGNGGNGDNGGPGACEMAGWIHGNWHSALPTNVWYDVKTGQTIGPIRDALEEEARDKTVLYFPVFDEIDEPEPGEGHGSFHVIGWAAFVIDPGNGRPAEEGVVWGPHEKTLKGYFVTFIATDLASGGTSPDHDNDFGVHVITLTK